MRKVHIFESRKAARDLAAAPQRVVRAYEIWANLIEMHGTLILKSFPGYHDEKLQGKWQGCRSSRLSRKWRVLYSSAKNGAAEVVSVERVAAHDYRSRK